MSGSRPLHPTGGILYFVGTFLVTVLGNVPLNNVLEKVQPTDANAAETWNGYLRRWTNWNQLRTASALLATLSFCLGLARQGLVGRLTKSGAKHPFARRDHSSLLFDLKRRSHADKRTENLMVTR